MFGTKYSFCLKWEGVIRHIPSHCFTVTQGKTSRYLIGCRSVARSAVSSAARSTAEGTARRKAGLAREKWFVSYVTFTIGLQDTQRKLLQGSWCEFTCCWNSRCNCLEQCVQVKEAPRQTYEDLKRDLRTKKGLENDLCSKD